jgi:hypothetical protein
MGIERSSTAFLPHPRTRRPELSDLQRHLANHAAQRNAFVFLGITLVFGYFCLSSSVRTDVKAN